MSGRLRRVVTTGFLMACLTAVATVGVAQQPEDGRNTGDFYKAVDGTDCFECHLNDNFIPMAYAIRTPYRQLEIDLPTDIELEVRWAGDLHKRVMRDIAVTIDTTRAPNVDVLIDGFIPETRHPFSATVRHGVPVHERIEVTAGAIGLEATAEAEPGGRPVDMGESLALTIVGPDGSRHDGTGEGTNQTLVLDETTMAALGAGDYQLELEYTHPLPQLARETEVTAKVVVHYGQDQTTFRFPAEGGPIRGADPGDKQGRIVTIPIVMRSAEEAVVDFRFEAESFYEHNEQDGAPTDDGLYYRFATMKVTGGDTSIRTSAATQHGPAVPRVDLYTTFTKILGFSSMVLVPMAMVTGGLFGKGSRRWLNRVTGGAKKRVLWHNTMSFFIIGVASLHFVLALVEPGLKWSKGLLWGGAGWALLMSLGFTGWYQVRMIKRWDYRTWRHVHLWSAVGVFAFGIVHMVLDGADLAFVREAMPAWHNQLVWP